MVVDTLRESLSPETSSLDSPDRNIFTETDPDTRNPTSTVDGDYALPPETQEGDDQLRAWVKAARRSVARWARENPY